MRKKVTKAFGKEIYLLYIDDEGHKCWLEYPSWDCGWYWGFGYIETYTNNNYPEKAKDISSHTHWNSVFDRCGIIKNNQSLKRAVWTVGEKHRLVVLFNGFYDLKEKAQAAHNSNHAQWEQINTVDIPDIMTEILSILSPTGHTPKITIPKLSPHA